MVQVLQDGDFFAYVFYDHIVNTFLLFSSLLILGSQVLLKLLWTNVEVGERDLLHGILIFASLDEVDGTVSAFANEVYALEAADKFVFPLTCQLLKVAHLLEVGADLA